MKDVFQNCSRDTLWWFSCLNTEADVSAEITLIEVWTSWLFLGVVGLCSHLSLWIPDSSWWAGDACNGLGVAQLLGLLIFLLSFQAPLWVWRCSPVHCWRVLWSSTRLLYFHIFFDLEMFAETAVSSWKPVSAFLDNRDKNTLFVNKPLD